MHYATQDPDDENSLFQDTSIQALQSRGVRFVSCHTSTEEEARAFIQQNGLTDQEFERVLRDELAQTQFVSGMAAGLRALDGPAFDPPLPLTLHTLLIADGFLFARYLMARAAEPS